MPKKHPARFAMCQIFYLKPEAIPVANTLAESNTPCLMMIQQITSVRQNATTANHFQYLSIVLPSLFLVSFAYIIHLDY